MRGSLNNIEDATNLIALMDEHGSDRLTAYVSNYLGDWEFEYTAKVLYLGRAAFADADRCVQAASHTVGPMPTFS